MAPKIQVRVKTIKKTRGKIFAGYKLLGEGEPTSSELGRSWPKVNFISVSPNLKVNDVVFVDKEKVKKLGSGTYYIATKG